MKHLKILGLALVAAAALTAFLGAGTASAAKLCTTAACTTDYAKGTNIESSLNGSAIFETLGGTVLDTCTGGEANGTTSATSGSPLSINLSALTWTGCTKTTDTTTNGALTIENNGGGNGTVSGDGSNVTIDGINSTSCVYGTATGGTLLGTLLGGSPATISISAILPRTVPNVLCPIEVRWTASYKITSPASVYVGA